MIARPRPRAIAAWSFSLAVHLLLAERLLVSTHVVPPWPTARMDVEIVLAEPLPTPPPPVPRVAPPTLVSGQMAGAPVRRIRDETPLAASAQAAPADPLADTERAVLERQARAAASQFVRENPPERRPFAGRDLDALLPDADAGVLPGIRPRAQGELSEPARRLAALASTGIPSAAVNHDAMSDLLTEGWEARHHGSDIGPCLARSGALDREVARALCLGKPLPQSD
jgi:hypothetical protein